MVTVTLYLRTISALGLLSAVLHRLVVLLHRCLHRYYIIIIIVICVNAIIPRQHQPDVLSSSGPLVVVLVRRWNFPNTE